MKKNGFTLIELMVVVAIIGILAAIAYPSYTNYSLKVHRTAAQKALEGLAMAMEKTRLEQRDYRQANGASTSDLANVAPAASLYPSQAPIDGSNKMYDLKIVEAKNNSFILRALPITGSLMEEDGFYELRSTGRRGWDQDDSGTIETSEWCWQTRKGDCS